MTLCVLGAFLGPNYQNCVWFAHAEEIYLRGLQSIIDVTTTSWVPSLF